MTNRNPIGGSFVNTEALRAFQAMTVQPTLRRKMLYDKLITDLKNASIWSKLDALYVMAAHDSQAARVNLVNPGTYDLTATNSPTFTTDVGYSAQGTNSVYLNTGFNPSSAGGNFAKNSSTIFGWGFDANQDNTGVLLGCGDASQDIYLQCRKTDGHFYLSINDDGTGDNQAVTSASGFFSGSRTGANATSLYYNGSSVGSGVRASVGLPNQNMVLANLLISGSATNPLKGAVGCAGFGSQLDATAHAALYTALNAYMQAVTFAPVGYPSTYQGPGDIVSSATAWYGLRAYNNAHIGANCVTIVRASDSATQTFLTTPGGGVDVSGITTFLTSTTGKVTKIWDQTGNGNHLTQGTDANRAAFTLSAVGSLPAASFTKAGATRMDSPTNAFTIAQPFTTSAVVYPTYSGTSFQGIFNTSDQSFGLFYADAVADKAENYFGASLVATATHNNWHSLQAVVNGGSSDMNVDGTAATGNAGATGLSSNTMILGHETHGFDGYVAEVGIWPVAFSSGNSTSMSSNQHSYWGF